MKEAPRVVMIGNSGVGKTSIVTRVSTGQYDSSAMPTIGAGVTPLNWKLNGQSVNFHVWDTAGQEVFREVVPLYFRDACVKVLVYSSVDENSFESLEDWLKILNQHVVDTIPIIVVENKIDLPNHTVDMAVARNWALSRGFQFFNASALTGTNITQIFDLVAYHCAKITMPADKLKLNQPKSEKKCC